MDWLEIRNALSKVLQHETELSYELDAKDGIGTIILADTRIAVFDMEDIIIRTAEPTLTPRAEKELRQAVDLLQTEYMEQLRLLLTT